MAPIRRGRAEDLSQDSTLSRDQVVSKRQKKKATNKLYAQVRERVADFVKNTINPGLKIIADEFDIPVADVREFAHLAVPAVANQRDISLWQAVVSVAREEHGDMSEASKHASEIYAELQQAIEDEDWDNEQLVMYEALRDDLEAKRSIPKLPKTKATADRALVAEVTRRGAEIQETLDTLRTSASVEFCIFICSGLQNISFPPHVYTTPKATDFFKLRTKTDPSLFVQELAGFVQHGSKVYEMLAVKDPKHKHHVSELLTEQLRSLTGNEKAKLQWVDFDEMCDRYEVELRGWPDSIPRRAMSHTTLGNAQKLHLLIREGTLRFERRNTRLLEAAAPPPSAGPSSAPPAATQDAAPTRTNDTAPESSRVALAGGPQNGRLPTPAAAMRNSARTQRQGSSSNARASSGRPSNTRAANTSATSTVAIVPLVATRHGTPTPVAHTGLGAVGSRPTGLAYASDTSWQSSPASGLHALLRGGSPSILPGPGGMSVRPVVTQPPQPPPLSSYLGSNLIDDPSLALPPPFIDSIPDYSSSPFPSLDMPTPPASQHFRPATPRGFP